MKKKKNIPRLYCAHAGRSIEQEFLGEVWVKKRGF